MNRREFVQGSIATVAVAPTIGSILAKEAIELGTVVENTPFITSPLRWTVHYQVLSSVLAKEAHFESRYDIGNRVYIKFKNKKKDSLTFKAQSLPYVSGKVFDIVPPQAVPWKYIQNRSKYPLRVRLGIKKHSQWQKRNAAIMYVVKTKEGLALVPAYRMRSADMPVKITPLPTSEYT